MASELTFLFLILAPGDVDSQTDLNEACGVLALPCLSQIGRCVNARITRTSAGIVSNPRACQCFVRGTVEALSIPSGADGEDVKMSCPFECADAIRKAFSDHMAAVNGDDGERLGCESSFDAMAKTAYGAHRDYIPSGNDLDSFDMQPVDDPKVVKAAESLLSHINSYRSIHCPTMPLFPDSPVVMYAKAGLAGEGKREYRIEVELGGWQLYEARLAHLPRDEELVQEGTDVATDLDAFHIASMSPKPCAGDSPPTRSG